MTDSSSPQVLRRICVYCASSHGHRPEYATAARTVGELLVDAGITLVYGGAKVGLMNEVADAALTRGGEVIGILPHFLVDHEIDHGGLTELHLVETMAERKALMATMSDAFLALPGGLGTLEELFEMAVLTQLQVHHKPVGVLNVSGFYDHLDAFLARAVDDGLMKQANRDLLIFDDDPARLLEAMRSFAPAIVPKWADR